MIMRAATATVVAIMTAVLVSACGAETSSRVDVRQPAGGESAAADARPEYLPPGARLIRDEPGPRGIGRMKRYALAGPANANTIPTDAPPDDPLKYHPATYVEFRVGVVGTEIIAPLDPQHYVREAVRIAKHAGTMTRARVGTGPIILEWSDGTNSYVLSTERLRTEDGLSGPAADEMIRIASSVRTS